MLGLVLALALAASPNHACFGCGKFGKTYVNTAGHVVRRPVLSEEKPTGASGRCKDGYWTFSETLSGACQGHKGVAVWLKR